MHYKSLQQRRDWSFLAC